MLAWHGDKTYFSKTSVKSTKKMGRVKEILIEQTLKLGSNLIKKKLTNITGEISYGISFLNEVSLNIFMTQGWKNIGENLSFHVQGHLKVKWQDFHEIYAGP